MPFTKIKYSKGETILQWQDQTKRTTVTHELSCSEEPRPELVIALQALQTYVLDVCEIDAAWQKGLIVQSVSISESALGRGIVVTALKKVTGANSPLVLNTPFLSEEPASEAGPQLPSYVLGMIDALEEEANKYRAGDRAQQTLFGPKAA